MIDATISYSPHIVANLTYTALNNLDKAWAVAQELFLEKAEESYDRMELPPWGTRIINFLRRGERPAFDLEYELRLMEPIETNETELPEFYSALDQYKYVEKRLADLHNRVGMIATTLRMPGVLDARLTAEDMFWLMKMAEGQNLLFRPAKASLNIED